MPAIARVEPGALPPTLSRGERVSRPALGTTGSWPVSRSISNRSHPMKHVFPRLIAVVQGVAAMVITAVSAPSAVGAEMGRIFASPEAAVAALANGVATTNRVELRSIFGPAIEELVNPDSVQAANEFSNFATALGAKHPRDLGRRHRPVQYQRLQHGHDGLQDAQHRSHCQGGRVFTDWYGTAVLHRRSRCFHHGAVADPHRPDQGRPAGRARRA
jgi:hypothetical protein